MMTGAFGLQPMISFRSFFCSVRCPGATYPSGTITGSGRNSMVESSSATMRISSSSANS